MRRPAADEPFDTVVLDVDGTLVDTVYQHTHAWTEAFAAVGLHPPAWRIHRAIGMGGDRLVREVAGDEAEERWGDRLREGHSERFEPLIDDVAPLPGAADLLRELRERGFKVVVASSGAEEQTRRLLAHVDGERWADAWTSSAEVEASKPAPYLVETALAKVDGDRAVMVGDAVWDLRAAKKKDLYGVGLLCGGFGEAELRDAGADEVWESPRALLDGIDRSVLARSARGVSRPG